MQNAGRSHNIEIDNSLFERVKISPYNRPQRAQRGSRGIALLILDLDPRRG
jgi:hypothetical protein